MSQFVAQKLGNDNFTNFTTLGLERDGELVAGVVYDSYTGANVSMHIAATPGRKWMTREFLFACFDYPFKQLDLKRVSGPVEQANIDALQFDYHLGFEYEATLVDAVPSGDLLMLVMWRDKCKWWSGAPKRKKNGQEIR